MKKHSKHHYRIQRAGRFICDIGKYFFHTLFGQHTRSFSKNYQQRSNGMWPVSYISYVRFQNRIRFFSASSLVVLVAGIVIVNVIVEYFFPFHATRFAIASKIFRSTSTTTVQNLQNAGVGSLRNAIVNANNGDTISFGNLEGTITLQTGFSQLTKNITITGNGKVIIDGTNVVGPNGGSAHGLYCAAQVTISDLTIKNFSGNGIYASADCDNATFDSMTLSQNDANGIRIDEASGVNVTNSIIIDNGGSGIYTAGNGGVFRSNIIGVDEADSITVGNSEHGIFIAGSTATGNTVDANTIRFNQGSGIFVSTESDNTIISSNIFSNNAIKGIHLRNSNDHTVTNNTIQNNGSDGVMIVSSIDSTFTENIITSNEGSGLYFDGETTVTSNHVLTNNRIGIGSLGESLGNQSHGVAFFGNVTNVTLGTLTQGNTIAYNTGSGVFIDAKGTTTSGISIVGNSIFENEGQLSETSSTLQGIVLINGANGEITAPIIADCSSIFVAGTADGVADSTVHVYIAGDGNQGKTFLGSVTTGDTGAWSSSFETWNWASGHSDFSGVDSIVATVTNGENSTSSFSSSCTLSQAVDDEEDSTDSEDSPDDEQPPSPDDEDSDVESPSPETDSTPFDYLKTENIEVNGVKVLGESDPVPVDSSLPLSIVGRNANPQHTLLVRLLFHISKKEHTVKTLKKNIVPTKYGTWNFDTETKLKKGKVYSIDAQATSKKNASKRKTLVRLIGADSPPTFRGDDVVLMTEQVVTKTFLSAIANDAMDGRFRILNSAGNVVSDCEFYKDASNEGLGCRLGEKLPTGTYTLQLQTLTNAMPSAPKTIMFIVSDNVPRENFYANSEDERFFQRITTSSKVAIHGIAPVGVTVRLSLDDMEIGDATRDGVGWDFDLDLSSYTRTQHVVTVKYMRDGQYTQSPLIFPLLYAPVLVEPTIIAPQTMTIGESSSIQFCGGKDNEALIVLDEEQMTKIFDEETEDVHACTSVTVIPTESGTLTVGVTAEDSNGLQGTTSTTVTVLAKQTNVIPSPLDPIDDTEENDDAIDPLKPNDPTNKPTEHTIKPSTDNEDRGDNDNSIPSNNDSEPQSPTPSENFSPEINVEILPYDDDIAEIYRQEETDPSQQKIIQQELRKDIVQSLKVVATEVKHDYRGHVVQTNVITPNERGEVILRSVHSIGLAEIETFGFLKRREDVVTFSGTTAPGASVKIIIRSDPIVKITRADSEGRWTITVSADILPEGEHSAFLQTSSRGVTHDEIEIARFVVAEQNHLSNTTWIFLINIMIAMLGLAFVVLAQFRKPKRMQTPISTTISLPHQQKKTKDDDENSSSFHSVHGV